MRPKQPANRQLVLAFLVLGFAATPADAEEYLATEESVHSHPTVMDAWFNGKAEVYTSEGLLSKLAPDLRCHLADQGIIAYGWSMTALQGNPVGGVDQDFQYTTRAPGRRI